MSALGFGPSLALRRVGGGVAASVFDFTAGAMPAGASLARASAGTRTNAAGLVVSEAADVARFDFAGGALAGLLVEPARTNAFSHAEQLDNGAWTLSSVTATANDRVAPDGATSAERLVFAGGGALQRTGIGAAGAVMSVSIYLYAASALSGLQFGLYDNVSSGQYAAVSLAAGVWTRVAVTRTFGAGASDRRMQLLGPSGGGTLWAWGAQSEAAGPVSSYVPTMASSATRAADVLSLALPGGDGTTTLRVTFDDLTTQDVVVSVSGGSAVLPAAGLARMRVRRIERV